MKTSIIIMVDFNMLLGCNKNILMLCDKGINVSKNVMYKKENDLGFKILIKIIYYIVIKMFSDKKKHFDYDLRLKW